MSKQDIEELALEVATDIKNGRLSPDTFQANLISLIRAVVVEEITKNNQDHYNQTDRALKRWGA